MTWRLWSRQLRATPGMGHTTVSKPSLLGVNHHLESKMPCHMIMARASLRQGDHGCHAMAPHCPPRVASVLLAGLGCAVLDLHSGSPTEVWSSTTGALPCGGRSEDSEDPTCRPSVLQRRFMFVISHPARATIRHCTLQGRIRPKRKLSACFEK